MNYVAATSMILSLLTFLAMALTVWATQRGLDRKADASFHGSEIRRLETSLAECVKARDEFGFRIKHMQDEQIQLRRENYGLYQQNFELQKQIADMKGERP